VREIERTRERERERVRERGKEGETKNNIETERKKVMSRRE